MFKRHTNSTDRNRNIRQCSGFDISPSTFGFPSDFHRSRQQAAGSRQYRLCRSSLPAARCPLRAAFSFTEILFAVMILSIGFIMVAAIFPVALQQAKNNTEETVAAPIARGMVIYLGQVLSDNGAAAYSNCPPVSQGSIGFSIVSQIKTADPLTNTYPSLWKSISGNLILPDDPRYACVVLYRRGVTVATTPLPTGAGFAQVYVFPVQARATPIFTQADITIPNGVAPGQQFDAGQQYAVPNLMARPVRVAIANDVLQAGGADLLAFDQGGGTPMITDLNVEAAAEGAYVVIANDNIASPAVVGDDDRGRMNGRMYRLGVRRADLDASSDIFVGTTMTTKVVFELQPGNDFTPDPGADGIFSSPYDLDNITAIGMPCPPPSTVSGGPADAFLIGRGYADPANPSKGYEGNAMPIAAYTTFVKVN